MQHSSLPATSAHTLQVRCLVLTAEWAAKKNYILVIFLATRILLCKILAGFFSAFLTRPPVAVCKNWSCFGETCFFCKRRFRVKHGMTEKLARNDMEANQGEQASSQEDAPLLFFRSPSQKYTHEHYTYAPQLGLGLPTVSPSTSTLSNFTPA